MDGQPQQGQRPWEPQEWHGLWLEWEGQWQALWLKWQGCWQWMFQQWQLELQQLGQQPLQQWHDALQQQWGMCQMQWHGQFELWKKQWQQQWGEWQVWQQKHRQSWKQHQEQWQRWRQQCQIQFQLWEQQGGWHWQQWQVHHWQPQLQVWQDQWNGQWNLWQKQWSGQWNLWQEWWQVQQDQWQEFERDQWQQEQQQWNAQKLVWRTKTINFVRLSNVLTYKPLTRQFLCDRIWMIENTAFGCLVADGFTTELFEAHQQNLSWEGLISEDDLYVSEDGCFVSIAKEPTEAATEQNKVLDFSQLVVVLFRKYIHDNGMMPPYLQEFLNRISALTNKSGTDLLASLWTLRNHSFYLDPDKWRVILEDYYKWYKGNPDRKFVEDLIESTNRDLCKNWHLTTVRCNLHLFNVYWDGREHRIPHYYYDRVDFTPRRDDTKYKIYRYTGEDGYLALFQRVFIVHGLEILKANLTLKELTFLIAHFFGTFLPCFVEQLFILVDKHKDILHRDILQYKVIEEGLITYTKRSSSSWRLNQRKMYEVE